MTNGNNANGVIRAPRFARRSRKGSLDHRFLDVYAACRHVLLTVTYLLTYRFLDAAQCANKSVSSFLGLHFIPTFSARALSLRPRVFAHAVTRLRPTVVASPPPSANNGLCIAGCFGHTSVHSDRGPCAGGTGESARVGSTQAS